MTYIRNTAAYIKSMVRKTCRSLPISKKSRGRAKLIRYESSHNVHLIPLREALRQYGDDNPKRLGMFIESYKAKKVEMIKPSAIQSGTCAAAAGAQSSAEPILLCAVKDDLARVKAQVGYHRMLGVRHFAYIDNMSEDGTRQWLCGQEDVTLFSADEKFHATVKDAWRRQVMDSLGSNRWYLVLDSDELFCYPGAEQIPITSYIKYIEKQGLRSSQAFLVDMYSKDAIFSGTLANGPHGQAQSVSLIAPGAGQPSTIDSYHTLMQKYCYFDTDTYKRTNIYRGLSIKGGPRTRVFSGGPMGKYSCQLQKNPLLYAREGTIAASHTNYPRSLNKSRKMPIAFLLHYKFLPEDNERFVKIAQSIKDGGIAYSGAYVVMMEAYKENPDVTFYHNGSQRLDSSMDLLKINICDRKFFEEFLTEHSPRPAI